MKHTAIFLSFCLLISCQQAKETQQLNAQKSIMVKSSDGLEKSNQTTEDSTLNVTRYMVQKDINE